MRTFVKVINSASRRTDISAFYSRWLINRIRAGFCSVPNPYNPSRISQVSLKPERVEAIVFWPKNPAPLMVHLDELDLRGFHYYFLITLNNYPSALETNLPLLEERLNIFLRLSDCVGPIRVIWRYDPIIISNMTSLDVHRRNFEEITRRLEGSTKRVIISFCDFCRKTERRLSALANEGYRFQRDAACSPEAKNMLRDIATMAKNGGMEIMTCAGCVGVL